MLNKVRLRNKNRKYELFLFFRPCGSMYIYIYISCQIAKAPQCFVLKDIYLSHLKAQEQGLSDFIDSASLMSFFGYTLHTVEGPSENIKITFPSDYYVFRAILEAKENSQIFGI